MTLLSEIRARLNGGFWEHGLVKFRKDVMALLEMIEAKDEALRALIPAAEFGSMEQSPPGFWNKEIEAAKEAIAIGHGGEGGANE